MTNVTKPQILIVDDTLENLKILYELLQNDYKVRPTASGKLAIKSVMQNPPDLIILDIRIPGMDGYEVCKILKSDISTKSIPIIFTSGLTDEKDESTAIAAGGVAFLAKPYSLADLKNLIHRHIKD